MWWWSRRPKAEVGGDVAEPRSSVACRPRRQLRAGQALKVADMQARSGAARPERDADLRGDRAVLTHSRQALENGTESDVVPACSICKSKRTVSGWYPAAARCPVSAGRPGFPLLPDVTSSISVTRAHSPVIGRHPQHVIRRQQVAQHAAPKAEYGNVYVRVQPHPCQTARSGHPQRRERCSSIDRLSQSAKTKADRDRKIQRTQPATTGADADAETRRPRPTTLIRCAERLPAFFKDQRAARSATFDGDGEYHRKATSQRDPAQPHQQGRFRITDFVGAKTAWARTRKDIAGRLLTEDVHRSSDGKGSVNRQEAAADQCRRVVTQLLPNGNLVVEGKQEIRVNFEIRELIVAGIVRPEDIQRDNTIDSSRSRRPASPMRPRPDHRRATAALRPTGDGCAAAVLVLPGHDPEKWIPVFGRDHAHV